MAQALTERIAAKLFGAQHTLRFVNLDMHSCTLILEHMPFGLEVRYLWVHPRERGAGIAAALMTMLCYLADREGQRIRLWTKPFACRDRSPYSLVPFYAKFGFEPQFMVRRANWYTRVRMHRG